jgi:hypothetical protein
MKKTQAIVPAGKIASRILLIRGHKVMLDSDLADLYGVSTKRLNEQVKRNKERFPADFMFQLTSHETKILRSQFATLRTGKRGDPAVDGALWKAGQEDRLSRLALLFSRFQSLPLQRGKARLPRSNGHSVGGKWLPGLDSN